MAVVGRPPGMLLLGSFGGDPADRLRVDTRRRLRAARERRAPATVPGRRAPDAGRGLRPGQMGVGKCVFFSSPIGFPRGARGGWGVFFPENVLRPFPRGRLSRRIREIFHRRVGRVIYIFSILKQHDT